MPLHNEPTRDALIRRHVERAVDHGATTWGGYADDLRKHYEAKVPERVRTITFRNPETDADPGQAMTSNKGKVLDWWNPRRSVRMPVEMEEAAVFAIPEPFGSDCRHELAYRLGCWGAKRHEVSQRGNYEAWGKTMQEFATVNMDMAKILDDGKIDENDLPDIPAAVKDIDATIADLISVKQQLLAVQEGKAQPKIRSVS